jgi:hypothetical protein
MQSLLVSLLAEENPDIVHLALVVPVPELHSVRGVLRILAENIV